jgi:DUF1680 family protein
MRNIALMATVILAGMFFGVKAETCSPASPKQVIQDSALWRLRPVRADGYLYQPLAYNEVRPGGLLAERMQGSLTRLLRDRESLCIDLGWGADQVSRWIGAMSTLAVVCGAPIEPVVNEQWRMLRGTQSDKGLFFGNDPMGQRYRQVWFGQARAIWCLLEYQHLFGDDDSLKTLIKAADDTAAEQSQMPIPQNLFGGIESAMGPMAILSQMTGRKDYLAYAKYVADNLNPEIGRPVEWYDAPAGGDSAATGPKYPRIIHHTHSYLCVTHGLIDLALISGEEKYLKQAKKIFEDMLPSVWITGGIPELYTEFYEYNDETCSVVDWIELCLKLYNVTGEARYLDAAELSILNHLLFSELANKSFVTHRSVTRRHQYPDCDNNRGYPADLCCTMAGPWEMCQVATQVVNRYAGGFTINLPLELDATTHRNGKPVRVSQHIQTAPTELVQKVMVSNGDDAPFDLKLRIPYWCQKPVLWIDGADQPVQAANGFITVNCPAKSTHKVMLHLPMSLQVIPAGKCALTRRMDVPAGMGTEKGLQYGPFVLMFDRQTYPQVKDHDLAVTVPTAGEGQPFVERTLPEDWLGEGAIPLFIKARLKDDSVVLLTPCANLGMTPLTVDDPYVIRFQEIGLVAGETH